MPNDLIYEAKCGFFNSVDGDRTYNANQMSRPYRGLASDGVFPNLGGSPNGLLVEPNYKGLEILVNAGEGIFSEKWFELDDDLIITPDSNTGSENRIDSVIIQVDNRTAGRTGNVVYRYGTTSPPAINQVANVVEYRLANVTIAPDAITLSASDITDLRGSECPWVTSLIAEYGQPNYVNLRTISKPSLDGVVLYQGTVYIGTLSADFLYQGSVAMGAVIIQPNSTTRIVFTESQGTFYMTGGGTTWSDCIPSINPSITNALSSKLSYGGGTYTTAIRKADLDVMDLSNNTLYAFRLAADFLYSNSPAMNCYVIQPDANTRLFITFDEGMYVEKFGTSSWYDCEPCVPNSIETRLSALEAANTILENAINGVT